MAVYRGESCELGELFLQFLPKSLSREATFRFADLRSSWGVASPQLALAVSGLFLVSLRVLQLFTLHHDTVSEGEERSSCVKCK